MVAPMNTRPLLPPTAAEMAATRRKAFADALLLRATAGADAAGALSRSLSRGDNPRLSAIVKASIPALAINDNDALFQYERAATAWLESLANSGVFDAALPDMRVLPIGVRGAVVTTGFAADNIDEGHGAPVTQLVVAAVDALLPVRATGMAVATQELLRQPGARELLEGELRVALATATDRIFLDGLIALTVPTASVGSSADDVAALLAAVSTGSNSRLFLAARPEDAKTMAVERGAGGDRLWPALGVNGGDAAGIRVVPTDGLDAGTAVLFDAAQIGAAPGTVEIDASSQADVQMDAAPTIATRGGSPTAPTAANLVSLFQTNSTATRVQRIFGFKALSAAAVASLSGVAWGSTGSP